MPAFGSALAGCGDTRLPLGVAGTVVAAQPRSEERLVPGAAKGLQKQLRNPAVARRDRMVGRLQRCVEGNPHWPRLDLVDAVGAQSDCRAHPSRPRWFFG